MGGAGGTRRGLRVLVLSFLLTALLRLQAEAFSVQVAAHEEECFFEQGIMGNNMTFSFQVTHGGFLDIDIDVEVRDPENDLVLRQVKQATGRYTFPVRLSGPYQFCFINRMSTLTHKEVMFTIDPGQAPAASTGEKDKPPNTLGEMIRELEAAIMAMKQEQLHMQVRQKTHRASKENTNSKVNVWAFFEAGILVMMALGQIYFVRRIFQARRRRTQGNAAG